jgi:nucleoside-diphosphate-sugar epimerase
MNPTHLPGSCLIIGCGYLGRRVLPLWLGQGKRVFALTRRAEGAAELAALGAEPVVGDVLRAESLNALPHVDTVLYAVGFDRASGAGMRQVYVDGLANVLAYLPRPKRFLYVSSSSVYGQSDGDWVDEASPTEPQEESGRIVLDAERTLHSALPDAVILRFSGIYGPGRLLRQATIIQGDPIVGDADKWLNLIHVEDGALAVLAAEANALPGMIVNVCDDTPVRRRDFYTELARVLAAPPPAFMPPPPGQSTPPHERGNRRIRNGRMKEALRVELRYPDYVQGLAASTAGDHTARG